MTKPNNFDELYDHIMSWQQFVGEVKEFDFIRKGKHQTPKKSLTQLQHRLGISHGAFYEWVKKARQSVQP